MGTLAGSSIDFAQVLDAVPQPIALCDAEGHVVFLNHDAREFLGVEGDGEGVKFLLHRRDTFSHVRLENRGPFREYYMANVAIVGAAIKEASMSVSPLGQDHFRVVLEEALGRKVSPILDEIDALVAICDSHRRVQLANAALSRLVEDLDGGDSPDLLTFFDSEARPKIRVAASEALAGGSPEEITAGTTLGLPPGLEKVRVRIRPLQRDSTGPSGDRGVVMVAQPARASFSELERRQKRAEKLMSLGELATGVAHELKNPLTSILNYAQYLSRKYNGQFMDPQDGDRLQRIIDGVERIDRFVRDLLKLAGAEGLALEEVELHEALNGAATLCRQVLRDREVSVAWELAAEDLRVVGNEGALHQVFMNLFLNAARAMPAEGGTITVATRRGESKVVVEVVDDGRGMTEDVLERIFEPFYSTRSEGGGAGLGLVLVRRIVEQHGGQIEVESVPGNGSTFRITLPA